MNQEYLLISSCLCGNKVKYNGGNNYNPLVEKLKKKYKLILFCPEVLGGLPVPRDQSEIRNGQVYTKSGSNVTGFFRLGAQKALELAKKYDCKKAVLRDKSPSCGTKRIYDGTFTGLIIGGQGIATKLLSDNGIAVYSEFDIEALLAEENE